MKPRVLLSVITACSATLGLVMATPASAKPRTLTGVVTKTQAHRRSQSDKPGAIALMSGRKRVGRIRFLCQGGGGIGAAAICSGPMSLTGFHGLQVRVTWTCHLTSGRLRCSQGTGNIFAANGNRTGTIKFKTQPQALNHKNASFRVVVNISKR